MCFAPVSVQPEPVLTLANLPEEQTVFLAAPISSSKDLDLSSDGLPERRMSGAPQRGVSPC